MNSQRMKLDLGMGHLYLTGSSEKCIRNEEGVWFTPKEFEIEGKRTKTRKWKQTVLCRGKTLEELLKVFDREQMGDGFNSLKYKWNFNNRNVKEFLLGFHSMIEKELDFSQKKVVGDKVRKADRWYLQWRTLKGCEVRRVLRSLVWGELGGSQMGTQTKSFPAPFAQ